MIWATFYAFNNSMSMFWFVRFNMARSTYLFMCIIMKGSILYIHVIY